MEDKRTFERFELKVPARVGIEGWDQKREEISLVTSNICAGGAYFFKKAPIPEGTRVQMDFVLSIDKLKGLLDSQCRIKVKGEVVRSEETGIAIRFDKDYQIESARTTLH